jgi:catechol 2,3-dioxygenase-like lactoylglutathione lyase family enzyme
MQQTIASMTLVVRDYDEAIAFYRDCLDFVLLEDTPLGGEKRWVRMAPRRDSSFSLLLGRAVNPEQAARVGDQTGGRVFLFLETDDFWRDYRQMLARGVTFVRPPSEESYGTVAVFADLYGNRWDLIEPRRG